MATVDLKQYIPVAGAQQTPAAPAGQNAEDWSRAHNLVNLEYQPQENSIYRQLDVVQQFLDRDINTQKQYGEIADQRLAGIATQLTGQLEQGVQQTADIFGQAKQDVGKTYDQMQQEVGQLGQGLTGGLAAEAKQLGVEGASTGYMNPIDRIRAEIAGIQARGKEAKAGSLANLDSLSAQFQAIGKSRVSGAQTEWAQRRSNLAAKVQGAITELQLGAQTDALEKLGKLTDIAESKGRALTETLSKLAEARSEREWEQYKLQLEEQEKAFDRMIKLRDQQLQESKFSWQQQVDTEKLAQSAAKAAKPEEIKGGAHGLKLVMDQMFGAGKGGTFRGSTRRFISDIEAAAGTLGQDPYKLAINIMNMKAKGDPQLAKNPMYAQLASEVDPKYAGFKNPADYVSKLTLALQTYFGRYNAGKA